MLQRGHHWSGENAGALPVGTAPPPDFNANTTDKVYYSSADPYQQVQGEEEEAMFAERDLAEDAQWKRIQQNTFTRWANEHLKVINLNITNLETDLSDGLRLIALIEVLSGKRMPKHNKRPVFRSQKLENVAVALKFLEKEGLKIINIDSSDIVDCKLKLIMGLIWTLILHYSISLPMWDDDGSAGPSNMTPKQRLLNWIQNKVPDLPINNFTNDWTDGKAVGALVDAVAPGLCPDWPSWDPKDALQNATEAMGLADDWLNVRPLITPDELVNPKVDEQSMMTYLSQYPNAKLKPGAPLRQPANPNRNADKSTRVRAYGPGIEPSGNVVGAPANFTVETFSAGKGQVDVSVLNPKGAKEPVDVRFNNDKNLTYSVSYTPKMEGPHKVNVKFNNRDIPKSPYNVNVEGQSGDADKVTATGPGLQPDGNIVGRPTYFDISTKNAGKGVPEVIILDPEGQKATVPAKVRQINPDLWRCEYVPNKIGLHSVNVFFASKQIPNSPFGVKIAPISDPKKVRAAGRGLQPNGVRVGDDNATFNIYTDGAGEGVPNVRIIGPGGAAYNVQMARVDGTTYACKYVPQKEGRYRIMITYGGGEIPKSPFDVNVRPKIKSSVVAYGPGLRGGIVDHPAIFTVETNGEPGNLGFSIAGPSQAQITCKDNEDGSCFLTYLPTAPGDYAVHVLMNEEDIPNSPFMATILPKGDFYPDRVKASGPGLKPTGVEIDKPATFTVDHKNAGDAPLEVRVTDCLGNLVPVKIEPQRDGTKKCTYVPQSVNPVTVEVNYGQVPIPNSPYRVKITAPLNPAKVQAFGPFMEPGVKPNQATHFNVDARDAGDAELKVEVVHDDTKKPVPVRIIDNGDNTYAVEVTPPGNGTYTTNLFYGGLKVPTPYKSYVNPPVDVSKVKVDGLEPSVLANAQTEFSVDMKSIRQQMSSSTTTTTTTTTSSSSSQQTIIESSKRLTCSITDPKGKTIPSKVLPGSNADVIRIMYTPFETGPHTIELLYDGNPIPGSPYVVHVKAGCDPTRVKAFGPGLQGGVTNLPAKFTVETKGAGTGGLSLAIEGPSEAKMTCVDKRDGSCDVEYLPTEPGEYDITVRFADKHIPGSPFKVNINDAPGQAKAKKVAANTSTVIDAKKVRVYGPGVTQGQVRESMPVEFFVDCGDAGPGKVGVKLTSTDGKQISDLKISDKGNGIYAVNFTAPKTGTIVTANVLFSDKEVPGSPFVVTVEPGSGGPAGPARPNPSNIQVTGDLTKQKVPASQPVKFRVANAADLSVQITEPEGRVVETKIREVQKGIKEVSFIPDDCGPYKINIKNAGAHISGSPYVLQSYPTGNADKCEIVEMTPDELEYGTKNTIRVDATKAGEGKITCRIVNTDNNTPVDVEIVETSKNKFDIYYTLNEPGEYDVDIKFGGRAIPDGSFSLKVE